MKKLSFVLLPLVLLAAACGGGDGPDEGAQQPPAQSTPAVRDADGDGVYDTTDSTGDAEPTHAVDTATGNDGEGGAGALFSTLNPFQLLSAAGGQPASTDVDPSLKAALLDESDLPSGFAGFGDFSYSVPSEFGDIGMVASMFASGDLASQELGTMVMSAVLAVPPDARDQFGDFDELQDLSAADLQQIEAVAGQIGVAFSNLHELDASGLGDKGFGMHMEMDFAGLLGAFGAPEGETPFDAGIAFDMYLFLRGERVLMAVVMWAADQQPGVDGRALAEAMDGKAAAAF